MTDTKWRSPTGHPIASDVTDRLPPKGEQVTKTPENVTCGDVSNKDDIQAALLKLDQMRLRAYSHAKISNSPKDMKDWIDKDYETIKRALAQQQPDAELLEALKFVINGYEAVYGVNHPKVLMAHKAIARAEQKGGE